jgi:hypothetical protein
MSYKVLITTEYVCSHGVSVHTQVQEFETTVQAWTASRIINSQRFPGATKSQRALCLFDQAAHNPEQS